MRSIDITVIVGFCTVMLSLGGLLLKHSIDLRAANQIKLDAAVRILQLFGNAQTPALPIQKSGAIFALCTLDQHTLALALLSELLLHADIEPAAASQAINHAFLHGKRDVLKQSVEVLYDHAEKFLTASSHEFPTVIIDATRRFPPYVRSWSHIALAKMVLARPLWVWKEKYPHPILGIVAGIATAWAREWRPSLRNDLGVILRGLLDAFPDTTYLTHWQGTINVSRVRKRVASLQPFNSATAQIAIELRAWCEREKV